MYEYLNYLFMLFPRIEWPEGRREEVVVVVERKDQQ